MTTNWAHPIAINAPTTDYILGKAWFRQGQTRVLRWSWWSLLNMSFWDTSSDGLEWRQFLCRASLRPTERPSRYNSTLGEPSYGRCTLLQVQILAASRPDFNRAIAIQQFSKCSLWEKNKALDPPTFHCCSTIQSALSRPPATVPVTEAETRKWWKDGCKIGYLPQSSQPAQSDFASWNDAKSSVGMQKQALNMTIFRDVGCPLIFADFPDVGASPDGDLWPKGLSLPILSNTEASTSGNDFRKMVFILIDVLIPTSKLLKPGGSWWGTIICPWGFYRLLWKHVFLCTLPLWFMGGDHSLCWPQIDNPPVYIEKGISNIIISCFPNPDSN